MEADQEEVYGWMGLNPALLLDPLPSGDNVVMRVVRPGCDAETVLEEARQQASSSGSRRRRRGRGSDSRATAGESNPGVAEAEGESEDGVSALPLAIPANIVTVEVPARRRIQARQDAPSNQDPPGDEGPEEVADDQSSDPRRRRRRSSATV
jgi:ribonuclease E